MEKCREVGGWLVDIRSDDEWSFVYDNLKKVSSYTTTVRLHFSLLYIYIG